MDSKARLVGLSMLAGARALRWWYEPFHYQTLASVLAYTYKDAKVQVQQQYSLATAMLTLPTHR